MVSAGDADPGDVPPGLATVGGITLAERQVRMALKAGAVEVLLVAPALPEPLATRLARDARVVRVADAAQLASRLTGALGEVLLFQPGVLLDPRLVAAVRDAPPGPLILVFGASSPAHADRLDAADLWAGLVRLPASAIAAVAAGLGEWELSGTLVRSAIEGGARRLAVETLPTYAPERRRDAPMLWARPHGPAECEAATARLLAAAQKGCLDWPARFLHPPVENALVRLLLPTPVTPNMVTLATAVLGIVALWAFATGRPGLGLALVLVIGPLDGVDGKLARTRHEFSRWGDLEHVLDKLLEYGWFLALGGWLALTHGIAAWLAAAGLVIFALTEAASGEFFRRFSGRQIDDWGPFERRFRLVAGRRNTFFWTLVPFGIAGLWWEGFLVLLAYGALTFLIAHWRLLAAIGAYGRQASDEVRENFARTSYDFLPAARARSR